MVSTRKHPKLVVSIVSCYDITHKYKRLESFPLVIAIVCKSKFSFLVANMYLLLSLQLHRQLLCFLLENQGIIFYHMMSLLSNGQSSVINMLRPYVHKGFSWKPYENLTLI